MKKILLLAAVCCLGIQLSSAQEKDSLLLHRDYKRNWGRFYIGAGAAITDYKLSNKLTASSLPDVNPAVFELSLGFTQINGNMLSDLEWNTDYFGDRKTSGERVRTIASGIKWRPQYIFFKSGNAFAAAGFDVSYMYHSVDIYTRGNAIDLDDLNPATHSGHISLYNNSWYLGPSASFGILQDKDNSFRVVTGYEWNVARASWKSDVANVANTVKEGGQGRFYAKLLWSF